MSYNSPNKKFYCSEVATNFHEISLFVRRVSNPKVERKVECNENLYLASSGCTAFKINKKMCNASIVLIFHKLAFKYFSKLFVARLKLHFLAFSSNKFAL